MSFDNSDNIDDPLGQHIKIDKRDLRPINNPRCSHNFVKEKDGEDTEVYYSVKCTKCPIGKLVRKT